HLHDQIGLAETPTVAECGRRGRVFRIAFRRACFDPSPDRPDLFAGQSPRVLEFVIALIGLPRRHYPLFSDIRDLLRALLHILITQQRKRRGRVRTMTRRAVVEDDRRDVFVECQSARRLRLVGGFGQSVADRPRSGPCPCLTLRPAEPENRAEQDGDRQKRFYLHKPNSHSPVDHCAPRRVDCPPGGGNAHPMDFVYFSATSLPAITASSASRRSGFTPASRYFPKSR